MNTREEGQTIAVLGPPAAGKTTVARLIATATHGRYLSMTELRRVARRDSWLPSADDAATPALVAAALRRDALGNPRSLVVLDDVVTDAAALDAFAADEPAHRVRLHVIGSTPATWSCSLVPAARSVRSAITTRPFDLVVPQRAARQGT